MTFEILILPTDFLTNCGHLSNLDLINYFWENHSYISCTKYAIVSVPGNLNPNILYLKDFRAESDGWTSKSVCDHFISYHKKQLQTYTFSCEMSEKCRCNVCLRQPPSLKGTALNFIVKFCFDIQQFELTADTTYQQYIFATNSISLPYWRAGGRAGIPYYSLVPRPFQNIVWSFIENVHLPCRRFHRACCPNWEKGKRFVSKKDSKQFGSEIEAVLS
jgi:hypothetical protein